MWKNLASTFLLVVLTLSSIVWFIESRPDCNTIDIVPSVYDGLSQDIVAEGDGSYLVEKGKEITIDVALNAASAKCLHTHPIIWIVHADAGNPRIRSKFNSESLKLEIAIPITTSEIKISFVVGDPNPLARQHLSLIAQ